MGRVHAGSFPALARCRDGDRVRSDRLLPSEDFLDESKSKVSFIRRFSGWPLTANAVVVQRGIANRFRRVPNHPTRRPKKLVATANRQPANGCCPIVGRLPAQSSIRTDNSGAAGAQYQGVIDRGQAMP